MVGVAGSLLAVPVAVENGDCVAVLVAARVCDGVAVAVRVPLAECGAVRVTVAAPVVDPVPLAVRAADLEGVRHTNPAPPQGVEVTVAVTVEVTVAVTLREGEGAGVNSGRWG